jgi:hypothetical protein
MAQIDSTNRIQVWNFLSEDDEASSFPAQTEVELKTCTHSFMYARMYAFKASVRLYCVKKDENYVS